MRFYTNTHAHYCGIDLHAKTMYLCILDRDGQVVPPKNMKSRPEAFLTAVEPFRDDLVVAAECIFTWYWLAGWNGSSLFGCLARAAAPLRQLPRVAVGPLYRAPT